MANIEAYGTNIVSNGASGSGGLTQQEHEWLESLASYTPNIYDINPTKEYGVNVAAGTLRIGVTSSAGAKNYVPVCGYDKAAFYKMASGNTVSLTLKWVYIDGTESEEIATLPSITWSQYYTIPNNAICALLTGRYSSDTWILANYSLLTKDSPYNPDNQS